MPEIPVRTPERQPLTSIDFSGYARTYRSRHGILNTITVAGVEGVDSSAKDARHPRPVDAGTFELPSSEAENLRRFFDEHIAHPNDDERYNCHRFGYAIAGWPDAKPPRTRLGGLAQAIATGRLHMAYDAEQLELIPDPSNLEVGQIYGVGKSGKISHSLIGLDGPSLSVLGIGKNPNLVIADGAALAEFYGGEIYKITSPSKIASSVYTPRHETPGGAQYKRPTILEHWGQERIAEVFSVLPETARESRSVLERFRPNMSQFPRPELDKLHDKGHLPRTLVWLEPITKLLSEDDQKMIDHQKPVDYDGDYDSWKVLRAAAVLHDIGRQGRERNKHAHGSRGAELIANKGKLAALLPDADGFNGMEARDVAYLVEKHHEFDHDAAEIDPRLRPSLTVLQTADGLDLARGYDIHGRRFGNRVLHAAIERTERIDDKLPIIKHTLRISGAEKLRQAAAVYAAEARERMKRGEDEYMTCLDVAEEVGLIVA